ncbi:carboxylate-amine ligase [Romeria aff. gracilis LEGE 07310]|uniref:Putative glutamate--cysteine ligase 2 n=1 Tax=Vasconcelosia minhoensis LEGE 07310 TaxID=915328 RepID=A0A8J7ALI0_9CYAN|nr:carboxylate-amine ligase [Romeria gracilis]MBE9076396.1 carboxylate-amine ligase [Romeria aff. gracilis LEGE 07310]
MTQSEAFTLGVEEEYQVIDPQTRSLRGGASELIAAAEQVDPGQRLVHPEMHRCQVEIATDVCESLADVRQAVSAARRGVIEAATERGSAIAAAGTHTFSDWRDQRVTPKDRYRKLQDNLQHLIRELIIFGCHVHVGIADREAAVAVVNRSRLWLPVLLALSANSPYWVAEDSGYNSYRMELWCRLPTAGPPPLFDSYDEHNALIDQMIAAGITDDPTKIYWDIRLSQRFPTIEFRVADVCATVDEAVMQAGLCRAIAQTCYQDWQAKRPYPKVRSEMLRGAIWCAARYGLKGKLVDFESDQPLPAIEAVQKLLVKVRPALEQHGDWEEVSSLVKRTIRQGNAAQRQRQTYEKTGSHAAVVDSLIRETAAGVTDKLNPFPALP